MRTAIRRVAGSLVVASIAALASPLLPGAPAAPVAEAAPAGNDTVVAYIARGVGNGHGRGLSQWGAYGRAVNGGQSWEQILDAYYGGTAAGTLTAGERPMSVRLLGWDGSSEVGVIDGSDNVIVNGVPRGYPSISIEDAGANTFNVWVSRAAPVPERVDRLGRLPQQVNGPVILSSFADESSAAPFAGIAVCEAAGTMINYRGVIDVLEAAGSTRVVNRLDIENYLRGVVPREVSASWGSDGGGAGMNSLRAQAVAARSYAVSQNRYAVNGAIYAKTCDSSSCQVYGGAATRVSPNATPVVREHSLTDQAIRETATVVRRTPAGSIVSTEFSASNGPRTAGGSFPSIDDPWDDVAGNPLHRWTRLIDADWLASWCGTTNIGGIGTARDPSSQFDGIWSNKLTGCPASTSVLTLRNELGYPSHGFDLVPVTRGVTSSGTFSFVGDSVGVSVAADERVDAADPHRRDVPVGHVRRARRTADAGRSERRRRGGQRGAGRHRPRARRARLQRLAVRHGSAHRRPHVGAHRPRRRARRLGDRVGAAHQHAVRHHQRGDPGGHVALGQPHRPRLGGGERRRGRRPLVRRQRPSHRDRARRVRAVPARRAAGSPGRRLAAPRPVVPGVPLRVPVLGQFGVPATGVAGVSLNVTAVNPSGPGWLRAWPCGSPEPQTSSVNYTARGAIEPNAVVVPVDGTGEICVSTLTPTDVLVDVSGWFDRGLQFAAGRLVDTRDDGAARSLVPGTPLRVPVLGRSGVPPTGAVGVALNVTAVNPNGPGWLRVWPCGSPEPETSAVNYLSRGAIEPNAVVVPVDATGEVCISTLIATEVLVDVSGWFDTGLRTAGGRLVDTRGDGAAQTLVPGVPLRVVVFGQYGVARADEVPTPTGVALNVTAVDPTGPGWLRVWPCASAEPETSSVNYMSRGAIEPNAVVVPVDSSGEVCISTLTPTEVLVDVSGWFDAGLRPAAGRVVDTRTGIGPIPGR